MKINKPKALTLWLIVFMGIGIPSIILLPVNMLWIFIEIVIIYMMGLALIEVLG